MKKPQCEIMAPVGNAAMFDAALAAGADAVYLGVRSFGARAYAENFSDEELAVRIRKAHLAGVRVYITVNTLIKQDEMDDCLAQIARLEEMGCDALIVQDLGLVAECRKRFPELPLHASTQMSVTSLAGAMVLEAMGFRRVVLGREISCEETGRIAENTDLELEVFAHGSLCVCVSGQCLLSSFAGGRSGNRGRCAQPCRKSYTLESSDGRILAENTYLSPRDLSTVDEVKTYLSLGIHAIKIEGRMKKPEYVYQAVRTYREARDGKETDARKLQLMTNRPFTKGFFFHDFGIRYAYDQNDETGFCVGHIQRKGRRILLLLQEELQKGDMLRLPGKKHSFPYTVTASYHKGEEMDLSRFRDLSTGAPVRQIFAQSVRDAMEKSKKELSQSQDRVFRAKMALTLEPGKPMTLTLSAKDNSVTVRGICPEKAKTRGLSEDDLNRIFGKLGGTPFFLSGLKVNMPEPVFVRISELNALRRDAVEKWMRTHWNGRLQKTRDQSMPRFSPLSGKRLERLQNQERDLTILWDTRRYPDEICFSIAGVDQILVHSIDQAEAWHHACPSLVILLYLPVLQEQAAWEKIQEKILKVDSIDGVYANTLNEWGEAWQLFRKGWDGGLALGPGLHLMNSSAFARIAENIGDSRILSVAPSLELTLNELLSISAVRDRRGLPGNAGLEWLVYGRIPGMVAKHCPASLIKRCVDASECASCTFRDGWMLRDAYGARPFVRDHGVTTIYTPETLDLRLLSPLPGIIKKGKLRIVDDGSEECIEALQDWIAFRTGKKMTNASGQSKRKHFMGHWIQGIE